jgi:WD40 repeat protein
MFPPVLVYATGDMQKKARPRVAVPTYNPSIHMFDNLSGFFFGRDVFVSYSYDDSRYAEALAVALQQRKFSVFLGGWGASPGVKLSRNVVRAARLCRLLVVVATPAAVGSSAVQNEIDLFASRHRTVVPIDVGGAIGDRRRWPGTDPVREEPGVPPSPHVLERIENAATFVRQDVRLRRFIAAVAVAAMLLIGGATLFMLRARRAQDVAEGRSGAADQKTIESTRALHAQQNRLKGVREDLDRQASVASALQLANDANLLAQREPSRLPQSAVRAVLAVRRLHERGIRALGADSAIRASELLPDGARKRTVRLRPYLWTISANGRFVAIADESQSRIDVHDVEAQTTKRLAVMEDWPRLISNDGQTILMGSGKIWRDRTLADAGWWHTISDDGKSMAMIVPASDHSLAVIVRNSDGSAGERRLHCPAVRGDYMPEFSPSGRFIALNGWPAGIWEWQTDDDVHWSSFNGHGEIVFNPADEEVVALIGGQNATIDIWQWRQQWGKNIASLWSGGGVSGGHYPRFTHGSVTFTSDGKSIAYIGSNRELRLTTFTETLPSTTRLSDGDVSGRVASMITADAAGHLAVAFTDGTVTEFEGMRPIARMAHGEQVEGIGMLDGKVTSLSESAIRSWSAAPIGRVIVNRDMPDDPYPNISPNADGFSEDAIFIDDERIATVSDEKRIRIWRLRDRKVVREIRAEGVGRLAVDPNRRYLAAALGSKAVGIWPLDGTAATPKTTLPNSNLIDFGFSHSGEFMVTVDDMHMARIWSHWDTEPVEVARLTPLMRIRRARFSEDDRQILMEQEGHRYESVLWRDEDFLTPVCARLDRLLDSADRALYAEACSKKSPAAP